MTVFRSKWLYPQKETDETDKSTYVSSGSAIAAHISTDSAITSAHGMTLDQDIDITNGEGGKVTPTKVQPKRTAKTAKRLHDVPSACLGPGVCRVIGICGRVSCLVGGERERFAGEVEAVRDPANPHRVPDEWLDDISMKGATDAA